jgi:hypothetical protein
LITEGPNLDENEKPLFAGMTEPLLERAEAMSADIEDRWGNLSKPLSWTVQPPSRNCQKGVHPSFILSHALDPRFMIPELIRDEKNREELWNALLDEMVIAKNQILEQHQEESLSTSQGPAAVNATSIAESRTSTTVL